MLLCALCNDNDNIIIENYPDYASYVNYCQCYLAVHTMLYLYMQHKEAIILIIQDAERTYVITAEYHLKLCLFSLY